MTVQMLVELCTCSVGHLSRDDTHFEDCFTRPARYYFNALSPFCPCSVSLMNALKDMLIYVMDNSLNVSKDVPKTEDVRKLHAQTQK